MFGILIFVSSIVLVNCKSDLLLKPCVTADSACLTSSAQDFISTLAVGIPALGLPPIDPIFLDKVTSDDGGLLLEFTNTTAIGMKDCTVQNARIDAKDKQHFTFRCSVNLTGNYKLAGRLLIFPINGQGVYDIKIRDIIIKTHSDIETVTGEDGKPHWHISKWRHTFDVVGKARFDFENLFNGNKLLADPIIKFANDNWRDVMQEIAPTIVKAILTRVIETVDQFYKTVPLDELVKS